MKLKIYQNNKFNRRGIHFGVNGQIRLKKPAVDILEVQKGDFVLIGTDESEGDKPKYLYIIKSEEKEYRAFKVCNGNGSHFIQAKGVIENLKIQTPQTCVFEKYEDEQYLGIKIALK